MANGTKSPRNGPEIAANFEKERKAAEYMDRFYESRGHRVISREGTKQYDLILKRGDKEEKIEEKFRFKKYDDILIEIVQDLCRGDWGWFYHTDADYLHYVFCTEDCKPFEMWRLKWPDFKDQWLEKLGACGHVEKLVVSPAGYGLSLNIPVKPDSFQDSVSFLKIDIEEAIP